MVNPGVFVEKVSLGVPLAEAAQAAGADLKQAAGWFSDLEFQRKALALNIDILILRERVITEAGLAERTAVAVNTTPQVPDKVGIISPLSFSVAELENQLAELRHENTNRTLALGK